jgi:hypothetical protein
LRIWDVEPEKLCHRHLLGEHRELHAIWNIITGNKKGYSKHPETLRWVGRLKALYRVHENIVNEMKKRGYAHKSPLDKNLATGSPVQNVFVDMPEIQIEVLKSKQCECRVYLTDR